MLIIPPLDNSVLAKRHNPGQIKPGKVSWAKALVLTLCLRPVILPFDLVLWNLTLIISLPIHSLLLIRSTHYYLLMRAIYCSHRINCYQALHKEKMGDMYFRHAIHCTKQKACYVSPIFSG